MTCYEARVDGQFIGLFRTREEAESICHHRESTLVVREVEPCNCEHRDHSFDENRHPYGQATAGSSRAQHVGPICDDCVDHMGEFLIP